MSIRTKQDWIVAEFGSVCIEIHKGDYSNGVYENGFLCISDEDGDCISSHITNEEIDELCYVLQKSKSDVN